MHAEHTGLGGGGRVMLDGQPSGDKDFDDLVRKCSKAVYETFFKGTKMDHNFCDAQIKNGEVMMGIEPSYMYEGLKIITISERKGESSIATGYAWGAWGTGIRSKERRYDDAKKKGKFVKFIDHWHPLLFKQQELAESSQKGDCNCGACENHK